MLPKYLINYRFLKLSCAQPLIYTRTHIYIHSLTDKDTSTNAREHIAHAHTHTQTLIFGHTYTHTQNGLPAAHTHAYTRISKVTHTKDIIISCTNIEYTDFREI